MTKRKNKLGGGRPKKVKPTPEPATPETTPAEVRGIISENELVAEAERINKIGEALPPGLQTEIAPGATLEQDLINLADDAAEAATDGTEAAPDAKPKPAAQPGLDLSNIAPDFILMAENSILLAHIEDGLDLQPGFLQHTPEEMKLATLVRPDDMEVKKSEKTYWIIISILNVSKGLKYFFYWWRRKKTAKAKAAEKKAKEQKENPQEETQKPA